MLFTWNMKTTKIFKNIVKHLRHLQLISQSIDERLKSSQKYLKCFWLIVFLIPSFFSVISELEIKALQTCCTLLIEFCNCSCGLLHKSRNSGGLWPITGNISHVTSVLRKIRSQFCSCSNTRYNIENLEGYPACLNSVECQVFWLLPWNQDQIRGTLTS